MSPRTRSRIAHMVFFAVLVAIVIALFYMVVVSWGDSDGSGNVIGGIFLILFVGLLAYGAFQIIPPLAVDKWKDGLVGVGTVKSYKHVGLRGGIREYSIDLLVESQTGKVFDGTLKCPIGRRRLAGLQPGSLLPVVFRESNPKILEVPQFQLETPAMLMFDYVQHRAGLIDQATINANYQGIPAWAKLLWIQPSGARITHNYGYNLDLEVYPPRGPSFRVRKHMFLNDYQHSLFINTQSVDVKFLPADPQQIVVKIPSDSNR